jgi:hypothetical protein
MPGNHDRLRELWNREWGGQYTPFFDVNRDGPAVRLSNRPRRRRTLRGRVVEFVSVLTNVVREVWQETEFE